MTTSARCASRRCAWLFLLVLLFPAAAARAQLAGSFYTITGIQSRVLPNAVQITIQTNGTVRFGVDLSELLDLSDPQSTEIKTKPFSSFRIRLFGARAQVPTLTNIGAYPVDSVQVTPGNDALVTPYLGDDDPSDSSSNRPRINPNNQDALQTDVRVRFYVPLRIGDLQFTPPRRNDDQSSSALQPLFVGIRPSSNGRAIVLTILTDRVDPFGAQRIRRQSPENQNHRLNVTPVAGAPDAWRIEALHTPLPAVLDQFAAAAGVSLVARAEASTIDVSLLLPRAGVTEFLRALSLGYGISAEPRSIENGGGYTIGREDLATTTERLALRYLSPERARLLLPDFLLPNLRLDIENNALIASGTPTLIQRLRKDLAQLDQPRPQVRVEARVYEISDQAARTLLWQATSALNGTRITVDSDVATVTVRIADDEKRRFEATVQALSEKRRVRLLARPQLVVVSGETGNLFLGQSRFVPVLREQNGAQQISALPVPVGYSLRVLPIVGGGGDTILLDLSPRVSTVDAIETGTGLPTLGIREVETSLQLRAGDVVVLAGLSSEDAFPQRRRIQPLARIPLIGPLLGALFGSRRDSRSRTDLIVLVSVEKIA